MEAGEVRHVYDNIPKSFGDDRLYRGLELKNNMKVLLISDGKTDKAAAAMDVHVGKCRVPRQPLHLMIASFFCLCRDEQQLSRT